MTDKKVKTSFTLSHLCNSLLDALSEWHGISKSSVLEMLVRERARSEGILPDNPLEGTDHVSDRRLDHGAL